ASFTQLEAMPLTASGKTNRKALPAPEASMATGTAYAAPGNETEEKLVGIWQELLRAESIGVDDNFFELGGHSLTAATLIALIHKELNHTLLLKDIFDHSTVRLLACRITEDNGYAGGRAYEPIERVGIQPSYPLSSAQYRLFVLQAMDENSTAYHLPSMMKIRGPLDRGRLLTAIRMLSERHETLRTSFEWMDGYPVQRISEEPIEEIDFELMEEEPDLEACIRSFVRPFRMSKSLLFRVKLARLPIRDNPEHLLLLDMHHLIADGVSSAVLAKQFVELYEGRIGNSLPVQYKDYAAWQAIWLKSEESRAQELFWKDKLSGAVPVLNLPTDYARPPRLDYAGDVLSVSLDSRATRSLAEMCARTGTTLYMALLGAFAALLHRYTGQNDIWIGSPVAGRPHADLADMIGMFVNTVVMRNEVHGELTFAEQLMKVKNNTLDALAHDRFPFEELVDSLAVLRDVSRNPLFDVMFVLQNMGLPKVVNGDVQFEPVEFRRMTAKFDLTLEIVEQADELRCHFEYRKSLFRRETIERLAEHFVRLIDTFVNNPELKLNDISLLSEEEHHQVVNTFNATIAPFPRELTLPELFRRQAEAAPDKLAASFEA
ncbi:condensation domain-containing protein, partial [Cohnella silvisoli]